MLSEASKYWLRSRASLGPGSHCFSIVHHRGHGTGKTGAREWKPDKGDYYRYSVVIKAINDAAFNL